MCILWLNPLFNKKWLLGFTVWILMLIPVYVVDTKQVLLRFKLHNNIHIFELGRNAVMTLIKTIIGGGGSVFWETAALENFRSITCSVGAYLS
jgi:hypothetical protein